MKNFALLLCLLVWLVHSVNVAGQDVTFEPEASLEELKEVLAPYEPIFITLTVENEDNWEDAVDRISDAIPIRSVEEDTDLRSDRIVISLDLRRIEYQGSPNSSSKKRWKVRERYTLEYASTESGALERIACRSAMIERKAPLGLFWKTAAADESEHRCLEIGTQTIVLSVDPESEFACRYMSIRALGWRSGHKTDFCKANGYEHGNFNWGEYKNGGICASGPEPDVCRAAINPALQSSVSCVPQDGQVFCVRNTR